MKAPRDAGSTPATSTVLGKDRLVGAVFSCKEPHPQMVDTIGAIDAQRKSDKVRIAESNSSDGQP
jgi:hypothetical protein